MAGMTIARVVRWLLVLPVAAGIVALLGFVGAVLSLWLPGSWENFAKAATDVLASAIAVYVGAKIAPSHGRAVAVALALLAAGKEFTPLHLFKFAGPTVVFSWLTLPTLAVLAASGLSALWFWRRGRSGFKQTWAWFVVVPLALATLTLLGVFAARSTLKPASDARIGPPQKYQGDGISFSYPGDWKLVVGDWDQKKRGRLRHLKVEAIGKHVGSIICLQLEPAIEVSTQELVEGFGEEDTLFMKMTPKSEGIVVVTIAGETVAGFQKDFDAAYTGIHVPMRSQWFALQRKQQTVVFGRTAAIEDWPAAEPKFKIVFDSFQAD
jgi:hypothetical protein